MPKKSQKHAAVDVLDESASPVKAGAFGRPTWSGAISFGLVNIPVKLYSAVRDQNVRFHMLHDKDQVRIHQKLVCPVDHAEVDRADIIKGYEISKNQHVVVDEKELESVAPKAQHTIELVSFVDIGHIDPLYFDRPFYVVPTEHGEKAYQLLLTTLTQAKKAGIGKFVMREKEFIAAIRPVSSVLCLETMHFADEVVLAEDVVGVVPKVKVTDAETKMAIQLVNSLSAEFDPRMFHNDYREALLDLIKRKAEGGHVTTAPAGEDGEPEVIDLMAALQKSLESAKKLKAVRVA